MLLLFIDKLYHEKYLKVQIIPLSKVKLNNNIGAVIKKGQGIKRKLPLIIDFAFGMFNKSGRVLIFFIEPCHDADWDSMITVHMNCTTSYTWNVMNYSIGKHALKSERTNSNPLVCTLVNGVI